MARRRSKNSRGTRIGREVGLQPFGFSQREGSFLARNLSTIGFFSPIPEKWHAMEADSTTFAEKKSLNDSNSSNAETKESKIDEPTEEKNGDDITDQ
jgi:hypothetical protein